MGSVTETSGAAMFSSCTEEEKVGQLGFIFSNQSLVLLWSMLWLIELHLFQDIGRYCCSR
jgi:hypothetical protein